jgi:hypothetical protein
VTHWVASVWKNDEPVTGLGVATSGSFLYSVVVDGGKRYACGFDGRSNVDEASLWIDDDYIALQNTRIDSVAFSLFKYGDDVYVAGYNDDHGRLWKVVDGYSFVMHDAAPSSIAISVKVARK